MARVFLSYDDRDRLIARKIEAGLKEKAHQSVWGVDELIAGKGWGELMPQRLAGADAVVALLTPNSVQTASVWAEIGAARALANGSRRMALLPVIISLDKAPNYTNDILVLWAERGDSDYADLIERVDSAIQAHLKGIEAEESRKASPKIFISHRHKDQTIARELTQTIRAAFSLKDHDIRCTSVQPYRLPFGKNTGERLRDEIANAQVVLGILAPDTSESSYVMFELGAAWSRRIYTCPLLSRGAEYGHIPGPIFDLAPARLWEAADCHQLLDNLEVELGLVRGRNAGEVAERIHALTSAARP